MRPWLRLSNGRGAGQPYTEMQEEGGLGVELGGCQGLGSVES